VAHSSAARAIRAILDGIRGGEKDLNLNVVPFGPGLLIRRPMPAFQVIAALRRLGFSPGAPSKLGGSR
jgi:hypothetical protein